MESLKTRLKNYELQICTKTNRFPKKITINSSKNQKQVVEEYFLSNGYNLKNIMKLSQNCFTKKYEIKDFIDDNYTALIIKNLETGKRACYLYTDDISIQLRIYPEDNTTTTLAKKIANVCELCPSNPLHATFEDGNFIYDGPLKSERKYNEELKKNNGQKMYQYINNILDEYDNMTKQDKIETCKKFKIYFNYIIEKRYLFCDNIYHDNGWSIIVDKKGNIFHKYKENLVVQVF